MKETIVPGDLVTCCGASAGTWTRIYAGLGSLDRDNCRGMLHAHEVALVVATHRIKSGSDWVMIVKEDELGWCLRYMVQLA